MGSRIWHILMSLLGVLCVVCWTVFFVSGLFIDSTEYRNQLSTHYNIANVSIVCVLYTPTNAAILTCLSGLAGGISSNLTYHRRLGNPPTVQVPAYPNASDAAVFRTENPFASMLRSFIVFLVFVAGLTVLAPDNPFSAPTQDQYLRVAATLSVLGFLVGYDPSTFQTIIRNVRLPGGEK